MSLLFTYSRIKFRQSRRETIKKKGENKMKGTKRPERARREPVLGRGRGDGPGGGQVCVEIVGF